MLCAHLRYLTTPVRDVLFSCPQHRSEGHRSEADEDGDTAIFNYTPKHRYSARAAYFRPGLVANHTKQALGYFRSRCGKATIINCDPGIQWSSEHDNIRVISYIPHTEQNAEQNNTGSAFLIAKMGVTRTIDLRAAQAAVQQRAGSSAAHLLIREQWSGNLQLQVPGAHGHRPRISKHRIAKELAARRTTCFSPRARRCGIYDAVGARWTELTPTATD